MEMGSSGRDGRALRTGLLKPSHPEWSRCKYGPVPNNLLVLSLARLDLETLVVHLVDVSSRLHVAQDVVLQLGYGLERVADVLVLLDIADDVGRLRSLGEVDEVGLLDDGRDAILDKGQIRQVDACTESC